MTGDCKHENIKPDVCDQTIGIVCCDCHCWLGVCWGDKHFSESLYNKACLNDPEFIKCKLDRDDVCGLCGANIPASTELVEDEDGAPYPEAVQKKLREMQAEIDRLSLEVAEYEASFELCNKADMRGIKMWQEAAQQGAPSRELVWPDRADLVVFLLERIDALEQGSKQPLQ